MEGFLKILWPFQKSWTLHSRPSLYSDMLYTRPLSGAEKKLSLPSLILSSLEQAAVPRIEHNSTASENMGNNSDQRKREKERSSIGCVHMRSLRKKDHGLFIAAYIAIVLFRLFVNF